MLREKFENAKGARFFQLITLRKSFTFYILYMNEHLHHHLSSKCTYLKQYN
jgi:hypothetical protein